MTTKALTKRHQLLTAAAHRGTLSENVLCDHIRTYVSLVDQDMTTSVGMSWMEEHTRLFHGVVKNPYRFHQQFISESFYVSMLLGRKEFFLVLPEEVRLPFARELVGEHSLSQVNWVHTLLEVGLPDIDVRDLVVERIRFDIERRRIQRPSSFSHAFVSDGQKFLRPKTRVSGVWTLLGEKMFFEVMMMIAEYLPKQVLQQIEAIRQAFGSSAQKLIEQCLDRLTDLRDVNTSYFSSMNVSVLYRLLMRIMVSDSSSQEEMASLCRLLQFIISRLDADCAHAATLRVRGLTQILPVDECFRLMRRALTDISVEYCSALADWFAEMRSELERLGWVFEEAKLLAYVAADGKEYHRVGCLLHEEIFWHDRYSDWSIHAGDIVMFLPAKAIKSERAHFVEMHPLPAY